MKVTLCTDSSSLLDASTAAGLGVDVVPVAVALDGEPYDELTSSIDWFYERIRAGAVAATSVPSPGEIATAYARAAARGADIVVSIHLDATVSGVVSAAELAARDAEIPVRVVDSGTVSYGVGLCVRIAAETLAQGGSAGDVARQASRTGRAQRNLFAVRTGPGGRIPETRGWTVFRYAGGVAERVSQHPSVEEAIRAMGEEAFMRGNEIAAAVGHAGREMEDAADALQRFLRERGAVEVERYRVGASVGAHTGADSFGLFWWPADGPEAPIRP
jgi:fatty acid-binding protein DegV